MFTDQDDVSSADATSCPLMLVPERFLLVSVEPEIVLLVQPEGSLECEMPKFLKRASDTSIFSVKSSFTSLISSLSSHRSLFFGGFTFEVLKFFFQT